MSDAIARTETVEVPVFELVRVHRPFDDGLWRWDCMLCGALDLVITKEAAAGLALEHLALEHDASVQS